MPSYRGVDQQDICASIKNARAFLKKYTTGPELDLHLSTITDAAIDAIAQATDDASLVKKINESGIEGTFIWISDLLHFHSAANTGGQGRAVVAALDNWGAAIGARAAVLSPVDEEIDRYIAKRPIGRLQAIFARLKPRSTPFQRYCLVIDGMKERTVNWQDQKVQDLLNKISDIIEPYEAIGEVNSLGVGIHQIYARNSNEGITFHATQRVAQAIANAYPASVVLDEKNLRIMPDNISKSQKPNPPAIK